VAAACWEPTEFEQGAKDDRQRMLHNTQVLHERSKMRGLGGGNQGFWHPDFGVVLHSDRQQSGLLGSVGLVLGHLEIVLRRGHMLRRISALPVPSG
jgi:hypothetical protein